MKHSLKEYNYRCKYCGTWCTKKRLPQDSHGETQRGDYGDNATPTPSQLVDEVYESDTISFRNETPASISDSLKDFGGRQLHEGTVIRIVSISGRNDGDYTIRDRGVSMGRILLSDEDSLTTETAEATGTVTISRLVYQPSTGRGCPLCGTLNS